MSARDAIEKLPAALEEVDARLCEMSDAVAKVQQSAGLIHDEIAELKTMVADLKEFLRPAQRAANAVPGMERRLRALEERIGTGNGAGNGAA